MSQEHLGVEKVLRGLRASEVTTTFTVERMLQEQEVDKDPENRRQIFEEYFKEFVNKPMADPWIYEPAIVDNYGIFDEFSRSVVERHNYFGVQNIIAHMENPHMVGSFLADPEHGTMLYWPGFIEYEWVRDCKTWWDFADKCVVVDKTDMPKLKKGGPVSSRLWLAYATMRGEYYNSVINPDFDKYFPEWRQASLVLDAMLLSRYQEISKDRLIKRGYYIQDTVNLMPYGDQKRKIQDLLESHPDIVLSRAR